MSRSVLAGSADRSSSKRTGRRGACRVEKAVAFAIAALSEKVMGFTLPGALGGSGRPPVRQAPGNLRP